MKAMVVIAAVLGILAFTPIITAAVGGPMGLLVIWIALMRANNK